MTRLYDTSVHDTPVHAVRAGADEGLGDGVGRRRRLLPGEQRDCVGGKRGERAPLDTPACADDAAERARHQEPRRHPVGARDHQQPDAGIASPGPQRPRREGMFRFP